MHAVDNFMEAALHVGGFVFNDNLAVSLAVDKPLDVPLQFQFRGFFVGGFSAAAEKCLQRSE